MGHALSTSTHGSTAVYVGVARLPQPLTGLTPSVAVELELDLPARQIVAVSTNLPLPGLQRMLRELLVNTRLTPALLDSVLELEVRYCAPYSTAIATAVRAALKRADGACGHCEGKDGRPQRVAAAEPSPVNRNGHPEQQRPFSWPNGGRDWMTDR